LFLYVQTIYELLKELFIS